MEEKRDKENKKEIKENYSFVVNDYFLIEEYWKSESFKVWLELAYLKSYPCN